MGAWAEESGKSEGRSVTGRIGIEYKKNIILCESRQTSTWSFFTREFTEPSKEEGQMNTVVNVCASSYGNVQWSNIDWAQCIRNVRRLQMSIVKATQ
jgi:hypothetical protein